MPEAAPGARPVPFAWSAGVGAAALLAYLWLAPAVPGAGDSGEFALVLALNGVAHPTGYPLYTLFGHLFVVALHGLGRGTVTWGFAANAWSAMGGGVAIALMHAFAARWIAPGVALSRRARAVLALLPVSLFALNPVWTAETTVAEVHAWHVAWVMGAALAFLGLARAQDDGGRAARTKRLAHAAAWGLLCGVGLAHHATAVLVAFPLSLALIAGRARARPLAWGPVAVAVAAALVPFASYASLYFKASHPGPAVWPSLEPSWASLSAHVTGAQYRGFLGHYHPIASERKTLAPYVYPFVLPWLPVLVMNAARARSATERLVGWAFCGAVILQLLFVFTYSVPDPRSYFLPAMALCLCAIAPFGVELSAAGVRVRRLLVAAGAALALTSVLMIRPWTGAVVFQRTGLELLEQRLRETWLSIPFESGVILWGSDMYHRLQIYQALGGEKPGIQVVNPLVFTSDDVRRQFVAQHAFDPLEGVTMPPELLSNPVPAGPEFERFITTVGRRMQLGMGLPVAVFDPRHHAAIPLDRYPVHDSSSAAP